MPTTAFHVPQTESQAAPTEKPLELLPAEGSFLPMERERFGEKTWANGRMKKTKLPPSAQQGRHGHAITYSQHCSGLGPSLPTLWTWHCMEGGIPLLWSTWKLYLWTSKLPECNFTHTMRKVTKQIQDFLGQNGRWQLEIRKLLVGMCYKKHPETSSWCIQRCSCHVLSAHSSSMLVRYFPSAKKHRYESLGYASGSAK